MGKINYRLILHIIFSLMILSITIFIAEILLKLFFPFTFATIGHVFSENAKLYGWGYNPHEIIRIQDPDTGEVYNSPANNHGWRDKDRTFVNNGKTFRILILGDSFTFGAIVPSDKIYSRVLEEKLLRNGYDAEVINISYGGWGTDQEFEALINEGLKYKPQIVIIQFHLNDLKEIMYFINGNDLVKGSKPFYYTIDDKNQLVRHTNPYFMKNFNWKERIKIQILKSEIGKRLYSIYFHFRWRESPVPKRVNTLKDDPSKGRVKYSVSKNQIEQLELSIKLDNGGKLGTFLNENIGKEINVDKLIKIIRDSDYNKYKDTILRILEKRHFHRGWSKEMYYPKEQNINSPSWRLYFAIIKKANSILIERGAKLAIFCHNDIEQYKWNVSWGRISNDPTSKINFLQYSHIIREYLKNHGIDFITNKKHYKLARNDPHPNIEGNEAMASDIYDYLLEIHGLDFNKYQISHSSN